MSQIYHHYRKWEDYKLGFYDNLSGKEKEPKINKVVEMFNSEKQTTIFMNRVIDEWKYSCQQNFSNNAINKIAYLGQAACCLYADIPATITMEAWSLLTPEIQERSNGIALSIIKKWESKNKQIQLCLSFI